jgi:hypothetical protein
MRLELSYMDIKKNSIIRKINTNEIYEVVEKIGTIVVCKSVNVPALKDVSLIPLKENEIELIMDGETDAFNLLFREDSDGGDES